MDTRRFIFILTGPTAVGKTELALPWAERHGAEIISCDSLLFYRGMDIGTAKPSRAERERVPHHLVDILDLTEQMDIARYAALARAAAEAIVARGKTVLVVGGSGLYLKTFFAPVADSVDVPAEVRARVDTLSLDAAVAELKRLNPEGVAKLDTANPRRVARALERCVASGKTLAALAEDFGRQRAPLAEWRTELTRLDREPEELDARIRQRVAAMLTAGLVEEVKHLRAAGLENNSSTARAIGYRETLAMLDGKLKSADLADEIAKNTRALVKKQRTWFRTQVPAHRVITAGEAAAGGLFEGTP